MSTERSQPDATSSPPNGGSELHVAGSAPSSTTVRAAKLLADATADAESAVDLSLGGFAMEAKSLIEEAKAYVVEGNGSLLPQNWAQEFHSIIDGVEARVRSEQVSQIPGSQPREGGDAQERADAWWRSKQETFLSSFEESPLEVQGRGFTSCMVFPEHTKKSSDSAILAELGRHQVRVDRNVVLAESHSRLVELQEDIHALIGVTLKQMADFRSLKARKTSQLAWFSILEEEYGILVDLDDYIEDRFDPTDDMGTGLANDILRHRFDALPVQLQAVFNMRCREGKFKGQEIDDQEMMRIIEENNKRTEMMGHIRDAIEWTQVLVSDMEKTEAKYGL